MLRSLLLLLCFIVSSTSFARGADINLASNAAQFKYTTLVGATNYGRTEMTVGFLYNEDHNDHNVLGEVGLLVIDEAGTKTPGLELGVGPKLWFGTLDKADANLAALGLGGQIRFKSMGAPRWVYGASLYYAPSIVAFIDADNMVEYELRVEYELLPTANAYVGYRNIKADIHNYKKSTEIDDSFIVGLRFKF